MDNPGTINQSSIVNSNSLFKKQKVFCSFKISAIKSNVTKTRTIQKSRDNFKTKPKKMKMKML